MKKFILSLTVGLLLAAPARAAAQEEQAFFAFEVERPAQIRSKIAPSYPKELLRSRVEGEVLVQFVVDERGAPQLETLKVIRSTDEAFTESVRVSLKRAIFHPAERRGKKVRQVVQQPYTFVL